MNKFYEELKRRNVIKAAISYLVLFWLLLQVGDIIFPLFGFSEKILKVILIIAATGFVPWVVFAYMYEWTNEGFKKTNKVKTEDSEWKSTGKKLNAYIISGLILVVLVLLVDRFFLIEVSLNEGESTEISLAVIPFENLSESEDAYFARGISEDIFIQISNLTDFKILSSYTLKDYDVKDKSLKEIGEELGVTHILLGNVRRSEDDIRIGCQLIEIKKEQALWANSFDQKISDIFSLQKEIAIKIAKSLVRTLNFTDKQLEDKKPTENLIAYDLYLRGRDLTNYYEGKNFIKASELLKEAITLDPYFMEAHSSLAFAYSAGYSRFGNFGKSYLDTAKLLAQKAIDLDPKSPRGWNSLGIVYDNQGKIEQAASMYLKSLEIDSLQPGVLNNIANYYASKNEMAKAIQMYKKSVALKGDNDPTIYIQYNNIALEYFSLGFYDRTIAYGERALKLDENMFNTSMLLSATHYLLDDSAAQWRHFRNFVNAGKTYANGLSSISSFSYEFINVDTGLYYLQKLEAHPDHDPKSKPYPNIIRAHHFINEGKVFEANVLLDETLSFYLQEMEKGIKFQNYLRGIAIIYALKGEEDKAVYWLEKLVDDGYINYHALSLTNLLDGLRDHPGYIALMEKFKAKLEDTRQQVIEQEASEQLRDTRL